MTLARIAFWLALAVWLGAVVLLSFVVAPSVFQTLPREEAGRVMGVIFPRYYIVQAIAGIIAFASSLMMWRTARSRPDGWIVVLVGLMLLAAVYAGAIIQPQTRALRTEIHMATASSDAQERFDRLHRRAVQLNAAVLLLGIACVAVAGANGRTARA